MDLRENCGHFWHWVKNQTKTHLNEGLLSEGLIVGDAHLLNFADALINGERKFRLVDKDEAGKGPFLFDFIHFMTTVRSQNLGLKDIDLFLAYRQGLLQEKKEKPKVLEEALSPSQKEERKAQEKHLDKYVDGNKFIFSNETELVQISSAPLEFQTTIANDRQAWLKELSQYTILDQAVRIKTTGGSRNSLRVWFLVRTKSNEKMILEFKSMQTTVLSEVRTQDDFLARMNQIDEVYWKGEKDPFYKNLKINGRNYLMRPRFKKFLDFDEITSEKDKERAREIIIHIAYHMGRKVADQEASAYIQALVGDPRSVFPVIEDFVENYLAVVKDLRKSLGSTPSIFLKVSINFESEL